MKRSSTKGSQTKRPTGARQILPQAEIDGLVELFTKDLINAQSKCIELLEHYPDVGFIHHVLACCMRETGEASRAIESHNRAIVLEPSVASFLNQRGITYGSMGESYKALDDFEAAMIADSGFFDAYHNKAVLLLQAGNFRDAIAGFEVALQIEPQSAICHFNKGIACRRLGQLTDALECYQAAVTINANYAEAYNGLGTVLELLDDVERARESFEKAVSLKPNYAEAFSKLGTVLERLGLHDTAILKHQRSVELGPSAFLNWHSFAITLHKQRRFDEALACFQKAADLDKTSSSLWNNRGATLRALGRFDEAISCYKCALQLQPQNVGALINLGNVYKASGKLALAIDCYDHAIEVDGNRADVWKYRGEALIGQNLLDAAVLSFEKATFIDPRYTAAYYGLAGVLRKMGNYTAARGCYEKAIDIEPAYAEAFSGLGVVLEALGAHEAAVLQHEKSVTLRPDYFAAWHDYAITLYKQGFFDKALSCFEKAGDLDQSSAGLWCNKGATLRALGRFDEAISSYKVALQLQPQNIGALINLGNVHKASGELVDAIHFYDQVIEIEESRADIWRSRGEALAGKGLLSAAIKSFEKAASIDPRYSFTEKLVLPTIPKSVTDIATWRARYLEGLHSLEGSESEMSDPNDFLNYIAFHLAYHNRGNKSIMERLSKLFRAKAPSLNYTSPHIVQAGSLRKKGGRIKVGFISEHLKNHTIGKLYQGYITHLDSSKFEVILIHALNTPADSFAESLNSIASKSITLPSSIEKQKALISELGLDVLFYPDIGMSPSTYFLAHTRLAPVQVVSWGHPDTTGIDTIDYYISSELIEPEGGQENYSENLICLPSLPCFYPRLTSAIGAVTRESFGLPSDGALYGCLQALFKFHPDFDRVLADIVKSDPSGHIVLIEGKNDGLTGLLRERWENTCPELLEKVIFLPQQPQAKFHSLLALMNVVLDPIYFGSGNTMYEAISMGIPIITFPGRFMRGRIVAGAYKQMGVEDAPIAVSLDEYVTLAVEFANDFVRRRLFKELSSELTMSIIENMNAVRELESFFEASSEACHSGKRLSDGWRPSQSKGIEE